MGWLVLAIVTAGWGDGARGYEFYFWGVGGGVGVWWTAVYVDDFSGEAGGSLGSCGILLAAVWSLGAGIVVIGV